MLRPSLAGLLPVQTGPCKSALVQASLAPAYRRILALHAMICNGALCDPQPATKIPVVA